MSQHSVIPSRQRVETAKQINPRVREQNTQTECFFISKYKEKSSTKEREAIFVDQSKQANTNDKPRKTKAPLEAVSTVTVIHTGLTDLQIPLEVSNHVVQNIPVILSSRPPPINNRVQYNLNFNNIIKVDIDKIKLLFPLTTRMSTFRNYY